MKRNKGPKIRDDIKKKRKIKCKTQPNTQKQNDVKHMNHKQISSKEKDPRRLYRLRPITTRSLPLQSYWKRTEMDSPW